jgi:uncharacterized repeat protein (TIGR03803 family)
MITKSGAETVLYSFKGYPSDGALPYASLIDVNGTLYGTTYAGGPSDAGTIFKITTSGVEKVLHYFSYGYGDGTYPFASLTNVNGTLYGTTGEGGSSSGCHGGCGTVFKSTTSGVEKVLYRFKGGYYDGAHPSNGGLTDVNGILYGTTADGGPVDGCGGISCGTVFKIRTSGAESVLYDFQGGSDGASPGAALINVKNALYSTTVYGGGSGCFLGQGCGTVFAITPAGAEGVLYRFQSGADGAAPGGGLTDVKGTLYGTTYFGGGSGKCSNYYPGCGTIFSITTEGIEGVLHSFPGGTGGAGPLGLLTAVNGKLYGITEFGGVSSGFCSGVSGCGTVFKVTLSRHIAG